MIIDVHTHILPPGWPELGDRSPRFERVDETHARIMVGGRNFRDITDQCWDPARRLADMDRDGVDRQVLSTVPVMFSYGAPPEAASRSPGTSTTTSRASSPRTPAGSSGSPPCRSRTPRSRPAS